MPAKKPPKLDELKALARKYLGRGAAPRTRKALVEALATVVPSAVRTRLGLGTSTPDRRRSGQGQRPETRRGRKDPRAAAPASSAGTVDTLVLLARDPVTAYAAWNLSDAAVVRAMRGLRAPRVVLRLLRGAACEREIDVDLAWRGTSLGDLAPGVEYRVELAAVAGKAQRRVALSNLAALPWRGPSPRVDDTFASVPWGSPLSPRGNLPAAAAPGGPFSEEDRRRLAEASGAGRPAATSSRTAGS